MSEEEEKSGRGFKVDDRRRFSSSGEPRSDAPAEEPEAPSSPRAEPGQAASGADAMPEMTFSAFMLGLSTQAFILLGEVVEENAPPADLPAAKQLIDILGMLQTKTKGNLDEAESTLLEHILYDLRMKYVQRARQK